MAAKKKLSKLLSQFSKKGIFMKKTSPFLLGIIFCCFMLFAGCASSELVDIWSDASVQPSSLNKMLVISIGKNPVKRRIWEDAFSVELAKHNIVAMPSYRSFPDAVPDTAQIIDLVRTNGFDGVLVVRWLPPEMHTHYMQGEVTRDYDQRYDRGNDGFITYYRFIQHAGTIDSQKVTIRAFDVWATKDAGRLIWSATSKTPEPNSMEEVRPEIVKLVTSELTDRGIIPPEK